MEKKELLDSQRQLILMKNANIEGMQKDLTNTLITIFREHGIPEKEIPLWRINEEATHMEKFGKKQQKNPPGKK